MVIRLVAVVGDLVGTANGETEVVGLDLGHLGELNVQGTKVGASDLLVERLGKHVDADLVLVGSVPELHLGKNLVGERAGHDEGGVAGTTAEVDKTALSKEDKVTSVGHEVAVDPH